jgi:hypothetical protein
LPAVTLINFNCANQNFSSYVHTYISLPAFRRITYRTRHAAHVAAAAAPSTFFASKKGTNDAKMGRSKKFTKRQRILLLHSVIRLQQTNVHLQHDALKNK